MTALATRRAIVAGTTLALAAPACAAAALAKLPPDLDPIIALIEERRACFERVDLDRIETIDGQLVRLTPVTAGGAIALLLLVEEEIACNAVEGDFIPVLLANARAYLAG